MSEEPEQQEQSSAKGTSRGDHAYTALKEKLIRGAFRPGEKLTVRKIAQDFGLSSTPARDALNRLVTERALIYAGPKTVVVPSLTLSQLREVTDMRLALEGLAAEKATEKFPVGALDRLENIQGRINAALDQKDYPEALWANKEFHFLLYGYSNMPILVATIEQLWLRIGATLNDLYPGFAITRSGANNHRAAMEGLQNHEPAEVRAAIETDIRDGYRQLRRVISERLSEK
ncbi:GntR family transcriptional regulator [Rhizobium terrae]|uniref:GntR family transcriptional regulator n=1 Tax=Rhizobium terrae TaxID=2171756 RepID=UPI000E3C4202|nr:GntR family transcriptional regulator [Rhizobium terrae]